MTTSPENPENWQVRCLVPVRCQLGEGPVWDSYRNVLYWVDIIGCTIYRFDPRSGALQNWTTPQLVGFVTVTEHDYVLIAGLKSGLHHLTQKPVAKWSRDASTAWTITWTTSASTTVLPMPWETYGAAQWT